MRIGENVRDPLFNILRDLQKEGKKIFLSFVTGLVLSVIILRVYVWQFFETVMRSNMSEALGDQVNIIAQTPFEVLLVQSKIGIFMGLVFSIPVILLILNKKIDNHGNKLSNIPRRAFYISVMFGTALFSLGLWYSYYVFFPIVFEFLASATVQTSVQPMYSIARWTQFMVLLSLSFGLIAQVPVSIPMLVRYEVVSYNRVKDSIRFWIVGTLVVGAILSPPEPISQVMWSGPLIGLYILAIIISKYIDPNRNDEMNEDVEEDPGESEEEQTSDASTSSVENLIEESDRGSDIGGYYEEISKIGVLLRNNVLLIVGVFMISGVVSFYTQFTFLTETAIKTLEDQISNTESFNIVALHPVELLMFQAKSSVLISLLLTSIVASLRIWPQMREDSVVNITRASMLSYILPPISVMSIGFVVGLFYVSPTFFDILIADANRIGADIAYQVGSFFWVVIYISIGFSGMLTVYSSILYLYIRGLSERTLSLYWRHILFATLLLSMFITPDSITKSLLLATPISLSFILSLVTVKLLNILRS